MYRHCHSGIKYFFGCLTDAIFLFLLSIPYFHYHLQYHIHNLTFVCCIQGIHIFYAQFVRADLICLCINRRHSNGILSYKHKLLHFEMYICVSKIQNVKGIELRTMLSTVIVHIFTIYYYVCNTVLFSVYHWRFYCMRTQEILSTHSKKIPTTYYPVKLGEKKKLT